MTAFKLIHKPLITAMYIADNPDVTPHSTFNSLIHSPPFNSIAAAERATAGVVLTK
jgi:hypothetical protein